MKINFFHLLLFLFFSLAGSSVFAQTHVILMSENPEIISLTKKSGLKKKVKNENELRSNLNGVVSYYQSIGYLSFSVDSLVKDSSAFKVYVYEGQRYDSAFIRVSGEELMLIKEANANSQVKRGYLPLSQYSAFSKKIISYYENNGFPFIEVYLDSVSIEGNKIDAVLKIDKKEYIVFDSLIVQGNIKLSKKYLYPYLGLRKGKPYNESIIKQIPQKIKDLPFATEIRESGLEFIEDKAYVHLFLDKRKTNQFDGVIGLVPVDENSGKVALNGELNLKLQNALSIGETLELLWRSPGSQSQYLKARVNFPYLFRTPFGLEGNFLLDKKDTTYLNMNYLIGIQYSILGNSYLKAYFDYSTSSVLAASAIVIDQNNISFADYKKSMYGLEFNFRKLDFIFNPRKGYSILLNVAAGIRKIIKNNKIDESSYDGIDLSSVRYRFQGEVNGYIPLYKRWVFVLGAKGGSMFGEQNLENELFKIGGMHTLRGFDEDAILASSYTIGLAEVRFLFAKFSYINLFFNGGWYEKKITGNYVSDTPYGFGLGIAFDTKAGIFSLSYALGKQFNNPISFKTGKIHFGIALTF